MVINIKLSSQLREVRKLFKVTKLVIQGYIVIQGYLSIIRIYIYITECLLYAKESLRALHAYFLILAIICEVGTIIISILYPQKLMNKEGKKLAKSCTASEQWSQISTPGPSEPTS